MCLEKETFGLSYKQGGGGLYRDVPLDRVWFLASLS